MVFDTDRRFGCFRNRALFTAWERSIERIHHRCTGSGKSRRVTVVSATVAAEALCAGCPIAVRCAQVATANRYTGIAGGNVFVRGKIRTEIDARSAA